MNQLSENELMTMMAKCMGDLGEPLDEKSFLDISFDDLDFDSLARVELGERIRERYKIEIPDDMVDQLLDPRALLDQVNKLLTAR